MTDDIYKNVKLYLDKILNNLYKKNLNYFKAICKNNKKKM